MYKVQIYNVGKRGWVLQYVTLFSVTAERLRQFLDTLAPATILPDDWGV